MKVAPTNRVAIYMRVSTDEQREKQTIDTQREFADRYQTVHNFDVHGFYADDGVSGTIPLERRPDGARLLDDARAGKFSTVMVYRVDRLGRDPRLLLNTVNDLEAIGLQVKSMTEAFDTSTPAGRLMLGMLSIIAGFERDSIVQRSVEGTERLARAGAWLGGIVPYGYRVEGKHRDAHLILSEDPLPGMAMSEADVIRLIYRLTVDEHQSCMQIADRLNAVGVPTAYTRDGREPLRGKRRQATAGIWRCGRVRNLIVSTTYRGVHQYGKRSKKERSLIERPVPGIVDEGTWVRAQEVLREHLLYSDRNAKHDYLMRGLMKCGLCGLTYIGNVSHTSGGVQRYYVCNGKHQARGIYGLRGQKCPSKSVRADEVESAIWSDIEGFLRNPGEVLEALRQRMDARQDNVEQLRAELTNLERSAEAVGRERDTMLTLYRKGRISEEALDRQLADIEREEAALKVSSARAEQHLHGNAVDSARLQSTEDLLRQLGERLDTPVAWDTQRQLVQLLVDGIRIDTVQREEKPAAEVHVTYRFSSIDNCTGRGSSRQRRLSAPRHLKHGGWRPWRNVCLHFPRLSWDENHTCLKKGPACARYERGDNHLTGISPKVLLFGDHVRGLGCTASSEASASS